MRIRWGRLIGVLCLCIAIVLLFTHQTQVAQAITMFNRLEAHPLTEDTLAAFGLGAFVMFLLMGVALVLRSTHK